MAKGQLFIMAAGDDISFPKRTQILYNYWQSNRNKVFAITSSMIGIDSEGNPCKITDRFFEQKIYRLNIEDFYTKYTWCGAGAAYDRKLYDLFGKIIYKTTIEKAIRKTSRLWNNRANNPNIIIGQANNIPNIYASNQGMPRPVNMSSINNNV